MKKRLWDILAGLFVLALFWSAPASAEWRRAESPNFIVFSEGSEARLRERILLLEEFHRFLVYITTVDAPPAPNKLTVYIVSGLDDLRRIGNVSGSVAGFYMATPFGVADFVDASANIDANETLFHEYAHHFMWQYAPSSYPAWYVEGFAEYFMTMRFERGEIHLGRASAARVWSVSDGQWIPMERVLFGGRRALSGEERARFYAQAWMIVHYFNSDETLRAKLSAYLAALRQGGDPREAFERTTGMNMVALTRAMRSYFGDGSIPYRRWVRPQRTPPEVIVTTLPRSANDLLLYEAALRVGSESGGRTGMLERVRTAAARHGDDPYARRVLAHAEVMHGDRAVGGQILESLLQASPNDAELLYLMGMRYLNEAEKGEDWEGNARQAARWFTRAHRADANHYQTLYRYSQSLRGRPDFDSENTANILSLANQLAPQVVEISMNTAAMLISRRDFQLAEMILEPLAASPHNESLAQAAQQMLERAREGRAAAAANAAAPANAPAQAPATPAPTTPRQ